MNRESKLAIIIGFSLVLVVAVLISDHFSRARTVQVGNDMTLGTARDYGAGPVGLTRPMGGPEQIPASTGPLVETSSTHTRTVTPVPEPEHSPISIVMIPGTDGTVGGSTGPDARPGPTSPADSGKPVSKGMMRTHEVKNGDKLYRLAAIYYNDGTLWKQLVEYNKAKVPSPTALRVGVVLDIPPKDVLLGEAVLGAPGAGGPATRPEAPRSEPSRAEPPRAEPPRGVTPKAVPEKPAAKPTLETYKIAKGDDLSTIAQKFLGSARRATEIFQLNKDVLSDPHTVIAGTVIKLPAR